MAEPRRARPTIRVQSAVGGWPHPWPNVEELTRVLRADQWTLIGGLMTQLHAINRGIGVVRPTNDVDIVLHIEARRGVPARTAAALESIGYHLVTGIDPRNQAAHRFTRGIGHVDLLTSDEDGDEVDELEVQKHVKKQDEQQSDIVDVLVADHAAPSVEEMLRGKAMVKVEGATQALRRTVNVVLEITPGDPTTISVPGPFGALILKAAAYQTDSRDRERHLYDAAATRLVRQVTEHFRTLGHEVLWGTCVRFATASVPFAPVAQALDSWALHVDPTVRSAVLEGSDALSPCRS